MAAMLFGSCTSKAEHVATIEEDSAYLDSMMQYWRSCPEEIPDSVIYATFAEVYERHTDDSLGLQLFPELFYYWDESTLEAKYAAAGDIIKNDSRIKAYMDAHSAALATGVGKPYIDVAGIDATTGKDLKLSDILAQGKPVLVDFWASWCRPCRRAITNELSVLAPKYAGSINVVGIAVWENGIEDTQKAMGELPISWPVIYAGGRGEDSPTTGYGIMGIPHIMIVAPDGTILARNLYGESIEPAIVNAISQNN